MHHVSHHSSYTAKHGPTQPPILGEGSGVPHRPFEQSDAPLEITMGTADVHTRSFKSRWLR